MIQSFVYLNLSSPNFIKTIKWNFKVSLFVFFVTYQMLEWKQVVPIQYLQQNAQF